MRLTKRAEQIVKAYGVTTLVLSDTPAVYSGWDNNTGKKTSTTVPQHYISPEHPTALMLTPAALGLTALLPEVVTIPTPTAPEATYENLRWVSYNSLERVNDTMWTNCHILVVGHHPNPDLPQSRLTLYTPPADALPVVRPQGVERLSDKTTAYRIGANLYNSKLVDFFASNCRVPLELRESGHVLLVYAGGQFVGLVMGINSESGAPEPHRPPAPNKKGVLPAC